MSAERLSYRYAKSLIDLAKEQGALETIKGDIDSLVAATADSRELVLLLKSPIVSKMKKASALEAIFGDTFDDMTMSFMDILLSKGREMYIPEIATEFLAQYKAMNKVSTVKVTTAQPMNDAALASIRAKLVASSDLADNVEIETAVDPSLIGGFKIEFNDRLYDASVAHRLNEMKKAFA
jgi:F-type H+-transporting ATPase subunit delta